MKIKNKINNKNSSNLNINMNSINELGKNNNSHFDNITDNYLMNNNNNNKDKMDIKKIIFNSEESNKNETPSFYLLKK